MSEAFINAISECHKDEVIKWLQKIYSENEQLRHDITRHVQICAEQANEIAELRNKLEQAEGILREIEAQLGCDKGNAIAAIIRVKHLLISTSTANSHDG